MKASACDPGDSCIAQRAEFTLFMPERAKSAGTPKRFQHVSPFPFFKVGVRHMHELSVKLPGGRVCAPSEVQTTEIVRVQNASFNGDRPQLHESKCPQLQSHFGKGNPKLRARVNIFGASQF